MKANKTFRDRANNAEKDIVGQIFKETHADSSKSDSEGEIMGNQLNMLTFEYNNFKPKKNKSLSKSGASRKASDRTIYHVAWPHEYSGREDIDYSSLGIPALVREETYIIHHIEPECYKQGRANHLTQLMYRYYSEQFVWNNVLDFHKDVLHGTESGREHHGVLGRLTI